MKEKSAGEKDLTWTFCRQNEESLAKKNNDKSEGIELSTRKRPIGVNSALQNNRS